MVVDSIISSTGNTTAGYIAVETPEIVGLTYSYRNGSSGKTAATVYSTSNTNQWGIGLAGTPTAGTNALLFLDYSSNSNAIRARLLLRGRATWPRHFIAHRSLDRRSNFFGLNLPLFSLQGPTTNALATTTLFQVSSNGSTTLFQIPSSILKTDSMARSLRLLAE